MRKKKLLSDHRFLIIAGTSRAGTTSVFNYFADHPQICASRVKETRFFLDVAYPLPSELRCEANGAEAYLSFFDVNTDPIENGWSLEATPDYLYSSGTAGLICASLPTARLMFLLREPTSRLLSFYQFGQSMNEIPAAMSFEDYIEVQKNNLRAGFPAGYRHPAFCALQHGRYSGYLKPFLSFFGRSSIHVAFQEDLARAPCHVMREICEFAGIAPEYFDQYSFKIVNKRVQARSSYLHGAYWRTKQKLRGWLRSTTTARSVLRRAAGGIDAAYARINVTHNNKVTMSASTEDFIRSYYGDEPAQLKELLGLQVPWSQS